MVIDINLEKESYPIYVENSLILMLEKYLLPLYKGKKALIISDDNVYNLYGETLKNALQTDMTCFSYVLPHGETIKSFANLEGVYNFLTKNRLTRSDLIIALGGGVVGDFAGFVASTYLRGIPFVQVPTSLLAMVDSSVGGKVAVDLPSGKNLVGSFYQPKMVLIDTDVLQTLPDKFRNDGMGEVIKYALAFDKNLYELLTLYDGFDALKNSGKLIDVITTCIRLKKHFVETDPFDKGERMKLNFGHTIGHAIEQHYNFEKYSHGEAVGIGMIEVTKISERLGRTVDGTSEIIARLLSRYNLPNKTSVSINEIIGAIRLDKKNISGKLNLIIITDVGKCEIIKVDVGELV